MKRFKNHKDNIQIEYRVIDEKQNHRVGEKNEKENEKENEIKGKKREGSWRSVKEQKVFKTLVLLNKEERKALEI